MDNTYLVLGKLYKLCNISGDTKNKKISKKVLRTQLRTTLLLITAVFFASHLA